MYKAQSCRNTRLCCAECYIRTIQRMLNEVMSRNIIGVRDAVRVL